MILSDSVPVWIFAGSIAAAGWGYEIITGDSNAEEQRQSYHDVSIATLEVRTNNLAIDIQEIKEGVVRIEQHLLNK